MDEQCQEPYSCNVICFTFLQIEKPQTEKSGVFFNARACYVHIFVFFRSSYSLFNVRNVLFLLLLSGCGPVIFGGAGGS